MHLSLGWRVPRPQCGREGQLRRESDVTISVASDRGSGDWAAWAHGMVGMLIFSASLPATRIAVEVLDPWFVTAGRAVIAGLLAIGALLALRAPLPARGDWHALIWTALGVVVGCTALFMAAAIYAYDPGRGVIARVRGPAAG